MGKLYTCNEIAERYSVKVITVWDWIRNGKLKAIKLPKGYRVSEEAVAEYESKLIVNCRQSNRPDIST